MQFVSSTQYVQFVITRSTPHGEVIVPQFFFETEEGALDFIDYLQTKSPDTVYRVRPAKSPAIADVQVVADPEPEEPVYNGDFTDVPLFEQYEREAADWRERQMGR